MGSKKDQLIVNKNLLEAIALGSLPKAKSFIDSGADPHFRDEVGWGVMHYAAFTGNAKLVEFFAKRKVDVNATSMDGTAPIVVAAARGHEACVLSMINVGAKFNVQDKITGNTPLMFACEAKNVSLIKSILSLSPNLDLKNRDGDTVLDFVKKMGDPEILATLEKELLLRELGDHKGFVGLIKPL